MVVLILHYQAAHKRSVVKLLKTIAALRKSEEQRKKSQAIGHIGNWEILLPSYASSMDEESYRIFGISEATVSLDEDFKNRVHPEDWEKLVLKMTPEVGKKYYEHEYRMRKPSGEEKIIHAIGELQVDKNGNPFKMYGIIQDITERKLAEEKQQKLLDITSFQNNKLKNFAYIVSHNIRSHSANITSLVDLLSKSKDVDERSRIQEMLKSTAGNLEETLLNLNEILTITENASLPKHKLQLVNEVQKTLEVLSGSICPKTTKVTVTIPEDIFIQAIPSYSDSILLNIISNAIKYRFPDRFSEIEISAKKLEDYVVLSVKDNGMGINLQKYGHKIFGMYKTFHNNADARGIGLFITKSHLEAMNGKIEVESEENIGTTFKIYFNEKD
jgi:PAS domain S-box-containing protein